MPVHRPPRYLRHKARNLGYSRIDGCQVYFPGAWNSAESLHAYEARLADWRRDADRKMYPLTVAELCIAYSDHAKTYYRKHGRCTRQVANITAALRLLLESHRHTLACDLDLPLLVTWRNSLIGQRDRRCKHKRRTLSRQYINKLTIIVLRMFRWARQSNLISKEQLADFQEIELLSAGRSAAPEAPKQKPVNDEDVEAVLPLLPPPVRTMVEVQRLAGMRPGEVVLMRPMDLTLRTDGVMVYRPRTWKTEHLDRDDGAERLVFLGEKAPAAIRPYLVDRPPEAHLFQPRESVAWRSAQQRARRKSKVPPSQLNRRRPGACRIGDSYSSGSYARAIARACEKAGVTRWQPNQLRKAASILIQDAVDLDAARALLGHRSIATTAKHYATQIAIEKAARAAKQIG